MLRKQLIAALFATTLTLPFAGVESLQAQFSGQSPHDNFRDTTILRPPAGSKVAIIVFEDLGCPACARAHPYEQQVQKSTGAALVRYDFPLEAHIWTFDGAVVARYIQDKINPALADQFRTDVFASQMQISNREDLHAFADKWLKAHGQNPPFVMDPGGKLAAEVKADYDLGRRLNVEYTPTIVVVTRDHYQVISGTSTINFDPGNLQRAVEAAVAQTKTAPTPFKAPRKAAAH